MIRTATSSAISHSRCRWPVGAGLASVEMRRHGRSGAAACGWKLAGGLGGFFIFIFFISIFYKNIFSIWKFTEIYPAGSWAAGANLQKITDRSLGTGRPAAGQPAPKAARLRGGRPYFFAI